MDYLPIHIRNRKAFKMVVPHGVQQKLVRRFGVNKSFVSRVLNQERGGEIAKKILHVAEQEFGGYWERKLRNEE